MLYEITFSYLAIGAAWIAVEVISGAGAALCRSCARGAREIHPALIPLGALLVSLMVIFLVALVAVFWPYFVFDEMRHGKFLKPGRWDDEKE